MRVWVGAGSPGSEITGELTGCRPCHQQGGRANLKPVVRMGLTAPSHGRNFTVVIRNI
jgi:hypothetical protein